MPIFDFLAPPFRDCPRCRSAGSYGVQMHLDPETRAYQRACRVCGHSESKPLPPVTTKVVYLDQVLISQVMKALHPEKRGGLRAANYWLSVFDSLHRACRLQILTCPFSSIHTRESIPMGKRFESMEAVFRHFSRGVRFRSAGEIEALQLHEAARNWALGRTPLVGPGNASEAVDGHLEGWEAVVDIKTRIAWPSEVLSEVDADSEARDHLMAHCFDYWKGHPEQFEDTFRAEVASMANALRQPLLAGQLQTVANGLVEGGVSNLRAGLGGFLQPEVLGQVPFVRIRALLYSGVARRAAQGQKNAPRASLTYDIQAISLFLPYCSALYLDSACKSLLTENPVAEMLGSEAKVFAGEDPDFLTYLFSLIDAVPEQQRLIADDLYGSSATPFRSLLNR